MQSVVVDFPIPGPAIDTDMALNEQDRAWIRETIRESIQNADSHRSGLQRFFRGLREWGGVGAAVAVLLFAATQWGGYIEFKTKTSDRLDGIEGRLGKVETGIGEIRAAQTPDKVLHEINGLDQKAFAKSLPILRVVSEQSATEAKPSQPLLGGIADKLSKTSPSTPEYWPTVLQFLQFASAGLAPANVPPPGTPPILKTSSGGIYANNRFEGVTVVLNGGTIEGNVFDHCRVIFTDTPVKMTHITFINSAFEFPVSSAPSLYIQEASKLLLASDLKTASIPAL
jgi:hypothetical protein